MVNATAEDGIRVLSWICNRPPEEIKELGLNDRQLRVLGKWMLEHSRLNMLSPSLESKTSTFTCQCGCGETFTATWTTRPPLYKDKAHRMRAYRQRRKERDPGWTS